MRILHFIIGKGNKHRSNGVNQVISGICKYSIKHGINVRVIGYASNAKEQGEIEYQDGFKVTVFSYLNKKLINKLIEDMKWCDFIHMHGIYNLHNIVVAMLARYMKIPYIITLHNGFAPNLSNFKKKVFDFFIQKKHIEKACAVHVITLEESTEIFKIVKPKKIILAHNGIDLEDFPVNENEISTKINKQLKIGFLGRISKEKNLVNVVKSLNEISKMGLKIDFYIAGPKSNYLKEVLSLNRSIKWVGPLYEGKKIDFIKSLDLFIHPSKADVFSIAAIEVLALGTNLLITRTAKASYFYNSNSFFMCEPTVFGIKKGILQAIEDRENWHSMSKRGKELVKTTLNWNVISKQLIQGYKEIL